MFLCEIPNQLLFYYDSSQFNVIIDFGTMVSVVKTK